MGDRYYSERRASHDGAASTDYHYSRSGPRYDDYESYAREHDRRSPSRELVRHSNDYESYAREYDRRSPSRDIERYEGGHHHRQNSRSPSHHHHHEHHTSRNVQAEHHPGKDLAATVLGAAVGGEAGRKFGDHSKLATAAGVLIGAWGGHELEKSWQGHEAKERSKRRYSHSQ